MIHAITILAFIPALFGYGSKLEADTACLQWVNAGVIHEYIDYYSVPVPYSKEEAREIATRIANSELHADKTPAGRRYVIRKLTDVWMNTTKSHKVEERQMKITARRCKYEEATKQVLGLESLTIKEASGWNEDRKIPDDFKVVKHFRF